MESAFYLFNMYLLAFLKQIGKKNQVRKEVIGNSIAFKHV